MQAPAGFDAGVELASGELTRTFVVARGPALFVCKRLVVLGLEARATIADEAAALARIAGRGAPRLIEEGEDAQGPWLVMERIPGRTLAEWGTRHGPRRNGANPGDTLQGARLSRSAFRALMGVHASFVVHGDLSPENVMVVDDGHVTLVDLGLARFSGARRTVDGAFRGTLRYAAPELARGEPVDERADLFALAASLLHALSGTSPRDASSPAALLLKAAEEPLDAWAASAAMLAGVAAEPLLRCLAFDRDARPAGAAEVAAALPAC